MFTYQPAGSIICPFFLNIILFQQVSLKLNSSINKISDINYSIKINLVGQTSENCIHIYILLIVRVTFWVIVPVI